MSIYKSRCGWDKFEPNTSYDWITNNEEQHFIENIKKSPNNDTLIHYLDNPITYKLNNAGFRTPDDFNLNDYGNVYLGCSHTFGVGHHLENIWSYKLNQQIGGKFWNLGIGGTGVMSHYRLLKGFYKELKIKNIFHYLPNYYRYEFIINHQPVICKLNEYDDSWKGLYGSLIEESLINSDQMEFIDTAFILAIKSIANEINCNYYLIRGDEEYNVVDGSLGARDLEHFTTHQHNLIYEKFTKILGINIDYKRSII